MAFTSTTPLANSQYNDIKGNAFDALDRPITRYYFVTNSGQNADVLQHETYTYDSNNSITPSGSNNTGLMSTDCNALQQCTYYAYDNTSSIAQMTHSADSSLDRTFAYDADDRKTSVSLPTWGTQYYIYDTDGRLIQSIEPSAMDSYATLNYHYYADGTRSSLDVVSSKLNQTGLFAYAYRTDGKMETQQINQPGNARVGTTTLTFTHTNAGRLTQRTESGPGANGTPTKYLYDALYGYLTEMDYPAGNLTGIEYDPSNAALGWNSSVLGYRWTYSYSLRGELLTFTPPSSQTYAPNNIMANGVAVNTQFKTGSLNIASFSASMDPRMGVFLNSTAYDTSDNESDAGTAFDSVGRITTDSSDSLPSANCGTCSPEYDATVRTYDQDNHVLSTALQRCKTDFGCALATYASATYDWGPTEHPIRIGSASVYETLHWDGDQLLFTTNANGLNDIKVGQIGDITPLDPTTVASRFGIATSRMLWRSVTTQQGLPETARLHGRTPTSMVPYILNRHVRLAAA